MKKLLILIFIPFLLSGCYDYNELNDLAIITGIAIDYDDNKYEVTFEILNTKKEGDNSAPSSSFTVSSKGDTITKAFHENSNLMNKVAYFDHAEIIIVSRKIAEEKMQDIGEYLIRTSKLRNEVYFVIADGTSAKDIIETKSDDKPIASIFLVDLLEHSDDGDSSGYYMPYTEMLNSVLTGGEDMRASIIKKDEDTLKLDGLGIFKDYKLVTTVNNEDASIINLLDNFNIGNVYFENSCDNGKTVISIYDGDVKIEPNDKNVKVKASLSARLHEDSCGYPLRKIASYEELQKIFTKIVKKKMNKEIDILKENQSNILSIGKEYYNKTRIKDYLKWTTQDFQYDIDLKINKKGLTYEVKE